MREGVRGGGWAGLEGRRRGKGLRGEKDEKIRQKREGGGRRGIKAGRQEEGKETWWGG